MPVDTPHPDYSRKLARWEKNLDAFHGEDAVKDKSSLYLVSPGGFEPTDYARYIQRAKWYGATSQTVKGLRGAIFQKDPVAVVSSSVEKHLSNITLTGIPLATLAGTMFSNVELIGRYGILLDYNETLLRPYWSGYPANNIINWRTKEIEGQTVTTMIVVKEQFYHQKDIFETEISERYRACYLNDEGNYQVDVYEHLNFDRRDELGRVNSYMPMRRMNPLKFVPFQIFGAEDLTFDIIDGPLDALIDINYAYYRHSADYEHGLFMTGLPTAVITGHQIDNNEKLAIGSLTAWVIRNPEAKAYMLEFQGQGLESHERAMANDKQEMATLGARLLEETPRTQETLGAVQIRHSGETGSLKNMANTASDGLTQVVRWHHWWNGDTENLEDENYSYRLNTDFNTTRLAPQEIQALMGLWQAGGISYETLFWNLKQGETIPDERTMEEEQQLIEQQAPARIPLGESEDDREPDEAEDEEQEDDDEVQEDAA